MRVFPGHRLVILKLALQGCGGDAVQAIEQLCTTTTGAWRQASALLHPNKATVGAVAAVEGWCRGRIDSPAQGWR